MGAFSRLFQRLCLCCMICKNGSTRVTSVPRIIFLMAREGFRPILGRLIIVFQLSLACYSKKEAHFKYFSIFYFPSLILDTKEFSSQSPYFKNSHFITSLSLKPTPTSFLLELGLEETGKCFECFLCVLEVSWLWQEKACGRYNNKKSHCVISDPLMEKESTSLDFLFFTYSFQHSKIFINSQRVLLFAVL